MTREERPLRASGFVLRSLVSVSFRTVAILLILAVVVALLFSTSLLSIGAGRSAELASQRLGADLIVLPPILDKVQSYGYATTTLSVSPVTSSFILASSRDAISNISAISQVSPQLHVGIVNSTAPGGRAIQLVAFDPLTDFTILPWLGAGSGILLGENDAVAGYSTGLSKGDHLGWHGLNLTVVSVLEHSDTNLDSAVFMQLSTAYSLGASNQADIQYTPGEISALLVRLHQGYIPDLVGRQISERIVPSKVVVARDIERSVSSQINALTSFQFLQEGVVGGGFLVIVGFLFSMSANEKRRQFGLLRSLGATRRFLSRVILQEACLYAAIGALIGISIGTALAFSGSQSLVQAFRLPAIQPSFFDVLPLVVEFVLIGVGLGALAALYPALAAGRTEPYEAIRRGD